jgi:hypothetical protein
MDAGSEFCSIMNVLEIYGAMVIIIQSCTRSRSFDFKVSMVMIHFIEINSITYKKEQNEVNITSMEN